MKYISTFGLIALCACGDEDKESQVNAAPVFTNLEIIPNAGIVTSTELLCTATATDENDDPLSLSYQWTNGDGDILSDSDELILSSEIVQPTDELICTATVSDGEADVSESTSVIVDNTAPTISNVSISPETVLVDSLLECSFETEDVDDEEPTVSYTWTQNGTEV